MLTEDNSLQKDIVASFYLQGISVKVYGDLPPAVVRYPALQLGGALSLARVLFRSLSKS